MHHGIGLDLLENVPQDRAVSEIALVEISAGVDGFGVAFGEIVENRNLKPLVDHLLDTNAADVACSTRDNNFFHSMRGKLLAKLAHQRQSNLKKGVVLAR